LHRTGYLLQKRGRIHNVILKSTEVSQIAVSKTIRNPQLSPNCLSSRMQLPDNPVRSIEGNCLPRHLGPGVDSCRSDFRAARPRDDAFMNGRGK
jgi:hypothetical protein